MAMFGCCKLCKLRRSQWSTVAKVNLGFNILSFVLCIVYNVVLVTTWPTPNPRFSHIHKSGVDPSQDVVASAHTSAWVGVASGIYLLNTMWIVITTLVEWRDSVLQYFTQWFVTALVAPMAGIGAITAMFTHFPYFEFSVVLAVVLFFTSMVQTWYQFEEHTTFVDRVKKNELNNNNGIPLPPGIPPHFLAGDDESCLRGPEFEHQTSIVNSTMLDRHGPEITVEDIDEARRNLRKASVDTMDSVFIGFQIPEMTIALDDTDDDTKAQDEAPESRRVPSTPPNSAVTSGSVSEDSLATSVENETVSDELRLILGEPKTALDRHPLDDFTTSPSGSESTLTASSASGETQTASESGDFQTAQSNDLQSISTPSRLEESQKDSRESEDVSTETTAIAADKQKASVQPSKGELKSEKVENETSTGDEQGATAVQPQVSLTKVSTEDEQKASVPPAKVKSKSKKATDKTPTVDEQKVTDKTPPVDEQKATVPPPVQPTKVTSKSEKVANETPITDEPTSKKGVKNGGPADESIKSKPKSKSKSKSDEKETKSGEIEPENAPSDVSTKKEELKKALSVIHEEGQQPPKEEKVKKIEAAETRKDCVYIMNQKTILTWTVL